MYKFVTRVNEIKQILTRFKLVELALESIIVLLIVFIILSFLGIKPGWILFVPSLIYSIIKLKYTFKYDVLKIIEERYPSLKERLSTVYDNKEQENVVVEDLALTVLTDIDQVKYSSFVATKSLGIRIVIILLLVTLILFTTIFSPPVNQQKDIFGTALIPESDINKININSDPEIFDKPSYVKIEGENERLIVYRGSGYEPNVRGEMRPVSGNSRMFPPEASPSEIYTEAVPAIYQQTVKNYFTNISS